MQPPSPHWRFMGQSERRPSLPSLVLALVLTLWFGAADVSAQAGPATLVVQLRTAAGFPVLDAQVQVVEAASNRQLAADTSDERGQVRFPALPATAVRVVIAGRLPNGTVLKQVGQDAGGIWLSLPASAWLMDLRVDDDGAVTPDLTGAGTVGAGPEELARMPPAGTPSASRGSGEETGAALSPTAPAATAMQHTVLPPPRDTVMPPSAPQTPARSAAAPTSDTSSFALLVALLGLIAGVVWVSARHRL